MNNRNKLSKEVQVYNAAAATGTSIVVNVSDFRYVVVGITAALNSTLTFKFKGSVISNQDLTAAQTTTNIWDYVESIDMEDKASVDGDTGYSYNNDTVANNTRQFKIDTDLLVDFAVEITAYTDGSLSAWVMGAN